jgi:hypothetical protein
VPVSCAQIGQILEKMTLSELASTEKSQKKGHLEGKNTGKKGSKTGLFLRFFSSKSLQKGFLNGGPAKHCDKFWKISQKIHF